MKFSFFGSVRNDWGHVRKLLNTIESVFWFASKEVVLIDDCSRKTEVEFARSFESENPGLSIVFNSKHEGIVPCLNQAIDRLSGDIALPIAADMKYVSGLLPFVLLYAFKQSELISFLQKHITFIKNRTRQLESPDGQQKKVYNKNIKLLRTLFQVKRVPRDLL